MKKSKIPKLCQNIGLGKLFLEKYLSVRLDFYFTRTATVVYWVLASGNCKLSCVDGVKKACWPCIRLCDWLSIFWCTKTLQWRRIRDKMSERAFPPLDLSGSSSQVAQKCRKWKRAFEITPKEKVWIIRERKLCSFYITWEWKFRIFSRILQTLTQLTIIRIRTLCALKNWITIFVLKKTYRSSDTCLGKRCQMNRNRWINT